MIAKTFEVRDEATCIPVLAVKLEPTNEADRWLLARSGYGRTAEEQRAYVLVMKIAGGRDVATCDPNQWGPDMRTMPAAHQYIIDCFNSLESGEVVDVRWILGEADAPCVSDRLR